MSASQTPPASGPSVFPAATALPSESEGILPARVVLAGTRLSLDEVVALAVNGAQATVSEEARTRIAAGREVVEAIVRSGKPAYGITTGVGSQKEAAVGPGELAAFNRRLLAAHATRVPGPVLDSAVVRAALAIQLNLFATGSSGVRPQLVDRLLWHLNNDRLPTVDASGSVGASDLVPLAQLALGVLEDAPETAFEPGAKEALSLMNSNAISLGQGALCLVAARRFMATMDLAAAMALEGLRGNLTSLSPAVGRAHRRHGQNASAARLRGLLDGSALWQPGAARFLQDPLSFRCVAQIHGVGYEALANAERIWRVELNATTDNPLIDLETGTAISHGNMDSTALTAAVDPVRQILAKICDLSGERLHKQHWPAFSGLPVGLASETGAMGGVQFLNLSHIAASLIASARMWAQPVLLTSVGQLADGVEDTAGLAMHAVSDLARLLDAAYKVATIELTIGCWAIKRRDLPVDGLGRGVASAFTRLEPLLPIGREGETPFSLSPLVDLVANGDLVEEAYAAADLDMLAPALPG